MNLCNLIRYLMGDQKFTPLKWGGVADRTPLSRRLQEGAGGVTGARLPGVVEESRTARPSRHEVRRARAGLLIKRKRSRRPPACAARTTRPEAAG